MFQYLSTFCLISLLVVSPVDCKLFVVVGLTALPARPYFPCVRSVTQSHLTLRDPMDRSLAGSCLYRFFRQKYWSGLPFPLQGIILTQGSNLHLQCLLHCRWILYCWATGEALPGIEPGATAVKVLSPKHWTTREVPVVFFSFDVVVWLWYKGNIELLEWVENYNSHPLFSVKKW